MTTTHKENSDVHQSPPEQPRAAYALVFDFVTLAALTGMPMTRANRDTCSSRDARSSTRTTGRREGGGQRRPEAARSEFICQARIKLRSQRGAD